MAETTSCTACQTPLQPEWLFCPLCGKATHDGDLSVAVGKQVFMYLVSFFLTPMGLWWGIKYIKSSDAKRRTIGMIIIALTILAILSMVFIGGAAMNEYSKILNGLGQGSYTGF